MNFVHTDGHREFRDEVRALVSEWVAPHASTLDREERYPADVLDRLGERRLTGVTIAETHGGRDEGLTELAILIEELSTALMPVASALALHLGVAAEIENLGSPALREAFLPQMARFETVGALGLTEANAGSDTLAMETTARRDSDEWVLSGLKQWVTNFHEADVVLTYAKTGPDSAAPHNVSAFLVPTAQFDEVGTWDTLGARCVKSVAVSLDDVRVPAERMVGEAGEAYVRRGEAGIGVNLPARAVGLARAALADTTRFVVEEGLVDPETSTRTAETQSLRHRLAEMAGLVETARLHTYRAADVLERGVAAGYELSMAKVVATEAAVEVTNEALRIQGPAGYTTDREVERYVRDARLLPIAGGPNDGHRHGIADAVLDGAFDRPGSAGTATD